MKYTNKLNLPDALCKALINTQAEHKPLPNTYHVTELIRPVREIKLTRYYYNELEQDVSTLIPALLGTATHHLIELAEPEHAEIKLECEYQGIHIVGKCDKIVDSHLYDWKTCRHSHTDNTDWYLQGMIYAFIYLYAYNKKLTDFTFYGLVKDYTTLSPFPPIITYHHIIQDSDYQFIMDYLSKKIVLLKSPTIPTCTDKEKWKEPDLYKVYKKGNTTRAVMTYNSYPANIDLTKYEIKLCPGKCIKCDNFCIIKNFC